MDKYYYFAAQLPLLIFNQTTYINREGLLAEANKWLTDRDFKILSQTDINDFFSKKDDIAILREYKDFERTLREELVLIRKAEARPQEILKSITLQGSPLEIEIRLLFLRWQFVETLEEGHYFDLEFFILYLLKLEILERLFTFDKEKGTVVFDKLCEIKL